MKPFSSLSRHLSWINLPGAVLVALLQRAPAVNLSVALDEIVISSPVGAVLKSVVATVAALGAVNSLAGATPLVPSAGSATGISVASGTAVSVFYTVNGTQTPPMSWTIKGAVPPGLDFSGLTGPGSVDVGSLHLEGTPTTAGTYPLTIQTFEFTGEGGVGSPVYNYSITVTGSTATAPAITTQPASQTVIAGGSVTFTAAASGSPTPTYQWKKGVTPISGATSASFSIASVAAGDAGTYSVVATNSAGTATSNGAVLTVTPAATAPAITTQPASQTVIAGGSVTFTAAASGSPAPTYQWSKGATPIAGATSASFSIGSVAAGDAGTYSVVATNSAGTATSNGAVLTVTPAATAPAITTQPASQTVIAGGSVTFTAAASGSPAPTYQWSKGATPIAGATSASFSIASVAAGDAGTYSVVATNSAGTATSNGAVLTVTPAATAPAITTQPASQTVIAGGSVTFTAAASGSPAPTYQWSKGATPIAGATSASFSIASVAAGDAGTYSVVATNSAGTATSNGAVLTVTPAATAPAITTQPASQTVIAGGSVTFTAAASGSPAPTYQWSKGATPIAGATSASFSIGSVAAGDAGTYSVVATNSAGTATSNGAVLTVTPAATAPAITTQPASQTVIAGGSATFTAAASGSPAPTYQWKKGVTPIAGATSASFSIASVAAGDAGTYSVVATNSAGTATSNGAVLTVTPAATAPAITTQPASQTVIAGGSVTFTAAASGSPAPTYQWSKGATPIAGATSASFSIGSVAAGDAGTYSVVATNSAGTATSNGAVLTVTPAAAPAITSQPASQTVIAGSSVTFSVTANGVPGPSYQWQVSTDGGNTWTNLTDTAPYSGTTTGTLTIAGATTALNGDAYRCVVTNVAGSVPSDAAPLTVNAAPTFTTQPAGQTVAAGGSATFTAVAVGNPTPTYQWQVSTDGGTTWANLTDTAPYSGTASGTLTVTGAALAMNGYQYLCAASNLVQSNVMSNIATLAVVPSTATADAGQSVISSGFTASWSSVAGATGYRLDVSTDSSFSTFVPGYQNLDVGNVTSAAINNLDANTTYYYRVRAYDSGGAGGNSSTITVATSASIVVATPLTVSTLAGQVLSIGSSDGMGGAAQFNYPSGVTTDNSGDLYVADTDNHTIRKIVASTGAVTTLAGLAGSSGSADGTGSAARFNNPSGVAVDSAGNVYVADTMNNTLRMITPSGVVTTLAGSPGIAGSIDSTGSAALFQGPQGLAIDTGGNLYVADTNNQTIRKVVPSTGVVTTLVGLAGTAGSADGLGSQSRFNFPSGVAVDGTGNIYVADTENHTIRQILPSGMVNTVAGLAGSSGGADGAGSAARFDAPTDVAVDSSGNVYVADTDDFTIREVVPATGAVTTLAGLAGTSGSADGLGSAARFFHPAGITVDSSSNLYVADTNNQTVRVGLLPIAPSIQTQPQGQTVTAGTSVQFSVTASGRPAVTYQWNLNGAAISGATGSSYSISSAQSGNAGNYTVVVSNVMGSVTSSVAILTVNAAGGGGSNGGGGGSPGGGGGGAPSTWFYGALLLLAAARISQRRSDGTRPANPSSA